MTERLQVEELLRDLHAARVAADLERLCELFAREAHLRIAGTSDGKPIAIAASGMAQIRPWLSMLVKSFRMRDYRLLSVAIDGSRAAAHWRVDIDSKITGVSVPTELVDLVETDDGKITSLIEFFVPY